MRELSISNSAAELLEQCGIEFNITDGFIISRLIENCLASPDKAREHLGFDMPRYAVYGYNWDIDDMTMVCTTDDVETARHFMMANRKQELKGFKERHKLYNNPFAWTDQQIEKWDEFIAYDGATIGAYDYEYEEYLTGDVWFEPEELKAIGWMFHDELLREKLKELQKGM